MHPFLKDFGHVYSPSLDTMLREYQAGKTVDLAGHARGKPPEHPDLWYAGAETPEYIFECRR